MRAVVARIVLGLCLFAVPLARAGEPSVASNAEDRIQRDIPYRGQDGDAPDEYAKERCKLDLYVPAEGKDFATVVWFHGGGLLEGAKSIPRPLLDQGIGVVAVNYRLSPKVKCPTYIEDAAAAVAWTFNNIGKHGGDPKKVFVAGHSAGGYLACMVVLDKGWLAKEGVDADSIAGLFSFSGQCLTHSTIRKERGLTEQQAVADRFAPIHHVRADAPPIVLITGDRELEMPARYEENALLLSMLKAAGHADLQLHELKGTNHNSMTKSAHELMLGQLKRMGEEPQAE